MASIAVHDTSQANRNNSNSLQCETDDTSLSGNSPTSAPSRSKIGFDDEEPFEPIAIVGFSLKFPQEATSPEAFWKMLVEKRCSMTEWPKERLNLDAFYHPDSNRPDTVRLSSLSYLDDPFESCCI